jgi:hypothetical protein
MYPFVPVSDLFFYTYTYVWKFPEHPCGALRTVKVGRLDGCTHIILGRPGYAECMEVFNAWYCRAYSVSTIIRRVGLTTGFIASHTITVYTLYNSQQLTLFSSSEDLGSNSATTAATNSYGVPCHHSLTDYCPRNSELYSP